MNTEAHPSTDLAAQQFWLDQMGAASALNSWVFSQFSPALGRKILEVGCGTGNFTRLLGESGAEVLGVELEPTFVEVAKKATRHLPRVRVEQSNVLDREWRPTFDTIVLLDVIEHIEDDVATLSTLREALLPGGRIIIKVPALPAIFGSLDTAVGHYRRYTTASLSNSLRSAGFVGIKQHAFNAVGILGWWLNGKVLRRTTPPAAQLKSFDMLVPIIKALDRIAPQGLGLSLVAIAEVPAQRGSRAEPTH